MDIYTNLPQILNYKVLLTQGFKYIPNKVIVYSDSESDPDIPDNGERKDQTSDSDSD